MWGSNLWNIEGTCDMGRSRSSKRLGFMFIHPSKNRRIEIQHWSTPWVESQAMSLLLNGFTVTKPNPFGPVSSMITNYALHNLQSWAQSISYDEHPERLTLTSCTSSRPPLYLSAFESIPKSWLTKPLPTSSPTIYPTHTMSSSTSQTWERCFIGTFSPFSNPQTQLHTKRPRSSTSTSKFSKKSFRNSFGLQFSKSTLFTCKNNNDVQSSSTVLNRSSLELLDVPRLVETFMTYNNAVVCVSISTSKHISPISIFNNYQNLSAQHIIEVYEVFYALFVIPVGVLSFKR